jgi:spore coat assembly protein SafA
MTKVSGIGGGSQFPMGSRPENTYIVKKGDTLWDIAQRFGVSLQELLKANPQIKNPDLIYPGQEIRIPLPESVKKAAQTANKIGVVIEKAVRSAFDRIASPKTQGVTSPQPESPSLPFLKKADIVFVNGILTDEKDAKSQAQKITDALPKEAGKKADLVYNPTALNPTTGIVGGLCGDLLECRQELNRGQAPGHTLQLQEKIRDHLNQAPPKPLVLVGYSQGSISTLNAVKRYIEQDLTVPPEIQQKGPEAVKQFIKDKLSNLRIILVGTPVNFSDPKHVVAWVDLRKFGIKGKVSLAELLGGDREIKISGDSPTLPKQDLQDFWKSGGILAIRHEKDLVAQVIPDPDKLRNLSDYTDIMNHHVKVYFDTDLFKQIFNL